VIKISKAQNIEAVKTPTIGLASRRLMR